MKIVDFKTNVSLYTKYRTKYKTTVMIYEVGDCKLITSNKRVLEILGHLEEDVKGLIFKQCLVQLKVGKEFIRTWISEDTVKNPKLHLNLVKNGKFPHIFESKFL